MGGPRLLSPSATRHLTMRARGVRQLHITGTATYPSRFLTPVKPSRTVGSKDAHRRVDSEQSIPTYALKGEKSIRRFNTSRTLKAVNDSSTIDFAYLPDTSILYASVPEEIRVPILPGALFARRIIVGSDDIVPVHRAEISTASGESTHISAPSAMSELSDTGIHMDFDAITRKAIGTAEKLAAAAGVDQATKEELVRKAQGMMQQVWAGLLDDVFGQKGAKTMKA